MLKWLIHVIRPQLPNECVQTLFFSEAAGHAQFGLGMKLPMNLLYTGISAFHFRFHFYREALLERIQEIEGDETFYPVTDI